MVTLNKQTCPTCGQSVNIREIALFDGMVRALFKVWKYALEKGKHEFSRKEIKHLFEKDENIIARFGDWVLFGGLVYRPPEGKGHYGLNMDRCSEFFSGTYAIPTVAFKNPLKKEILYGEYQKLGQIRKFRSFLTENWDFIVNYRDEVKGVPSEVQQKLV